MHALGFYHEHTRPDRDKYILIREDNVRKGQLNSRIHSTRNERFIVEALDFDLRVISSFRSPFSTLRFSLKIESFTKQNMFYSSDILQFQVSKVSI